LNHKHNIKKTHVSFIEFDDVLTARLAIDTNYFGEGNSKGRRLEFDFKYCLECDLRLLNNEPFLTKDILEQEFERFVTQARNNKFESSETTTMQHTDFETLERLIKSALAFGKLKQRFA
jgi:hypothetical protein